MFPLFFFNDTATTEIYTLSLHDALPIFFFDEIGDMSPYAQAKILRAIESKQLQRLGGKENISLNIRVMAATNQDLEKSMAEGKFRKDLFFRLNVVRIHLPPLRDRMDDIPSLIDYYIRELNCQF